MAKRKRLTPADPSRVEGGSGLSAGAAFSATSAAPIASVAGEASAEAALAEVSEVLTKARAEGRLVEEVGLRAIDENYLTRDRVVADPEEMAILKESLRTRGQQTPIEVVAVGKDHYGLISGWRRLTAMRELSEESGGFGFGLIDALVRTPESAGDAYVAMVEENEIRVGLSYFERARIAVKAVEQGVYSDAKAALLGLFATASRAKRSKIRSFMPLVEALDGALAFPHRLPERMGLQVSRALGKDLGLAQRMRDGLEQAKPGTPQEEQAVLAGLMRKDGPVLRRKDPGEVRFEVKKGMYLSWKPSEEGGRYVIEGPKVSKQIRYHLTEFLKTR